MSNLCLSHGLAAAAANVCIYLETVLLSARFVSVLPLTCLTCVDMLVILLWVIFFGKAVPASVPGENCTFAVSGV